MEDFDGGGGGLTPLAGAADDDSAGLDAVAFEDFGLFGVYGELEGFRGEFGGVGGPFLLRW